MKKINLKNYKLKTPTKKFNHDWEVWADELTAYFKRNCYWLFHRYEKHKIINAYKYCKEKGIDKINYMLGMLNK